MLGAQPLEHLQRAIDRFRTPTQFIGLAVLIALSANVALGRPKPQAASAFRLDAVGGLELINAEADVITYRGRRAIRLLPLAGRENKAESLLAIVRGTEFGDGTIEVDVAAAPRAGADTSARGFVGVAFRVAAQASRYESFYLRPTNGRAEDQLRRNHSTQYVSFPDFPWQRLRRETPGVYESYVDLEAGVWTKMRIDVKGTTARLFVNGATQPTLVVHDLKLGDTRGQIALWSFSDTAAHFSNLKIRRVLSQP